MAPAMATKRLRKELIKLQSDPTPGIIAEPDERNILKLYYAIRGPTETVYDGGIYVGKLIFPPEYPMKAPSIYLLTPSGRFQINTKICMSMSDFHPESWNPLWSCATIIQGVQSFMASDELTTGGLRASDSDRKRFAKYSMAYNKKTYPKLFDGDIEAALEAAEQSRQNSEEEKVNEVNSSDGKEENKKLSRRERRLAKNNRSNPKEKESKERNDQDSNKCSKDDDDNTDNEASTTMQQLSLEEIEKRRKRNAKKRAKQKAKKAASTLDVTEEIKTESNDS